MVCLDTAYLLKAENLLLKTLLQNNFLWDSQLTYLCAFFEVWLGYEQCRGTQPKNAKRLIILRQTHAYYRIFCVCSIARLYLYSYLLLYHMVACSSYCPNIVWHCSLAIN